MKRLFFILSFGLLVAFGVGIAWQNAGLPSALADGFIIIDPVTPSVNLSVKEHNVKVTIENQVANVEIDQTFYNPNDFEVEGTYLFPIPEGAVISNFAMWDDGEKLTGEILDADEASAIYNDYVLKMIDPALLEYTGSGLYKASIYPIGADEEKTIEVSYVQTLPLKGGYLDFWYPLSTEKYSSDELESVSIQVEIESAEDIKSVYSPTHSTSVNLLTDRTATASYEATNVLPDKDYELLIGLDEDDFGLNVVTYRDAGGDGSAGGDGYFMLMAAPRVEIAEEDLIPKDVVFVLDVSGSMYGTKMDQAKEALEYVLDALKNSSTADRDRFNIISFSDYVGTFSESGLKEATSDNIGEAESFVDGLEAIGGTNINEALLKALESVSSSSTNSKVIVFLTDGAPTVGEVDTGKIADNIEAANTAGARIFVFGVGDDVNTHLLDAISGDSHSVSTYVSENESIDSEVSDFYDKIAYPVLNDVSIEFGTDIGDYDVYPAILPDLYKGSQIILFGRYNKSAEATTATLRGTSKGEEKSFTYDVSFPGPEAQDEGASYIPTLWATRKIGNLLDEIRLNGESGELVNSVIELSKKYGIVTEYTSFLIDQDIPETDSYDTFTKSLEESNFWMPTGSGAFDAAENTQQLKDTDTVDDALGTYDIVKNVGAKTFYYEDERWVDSDYAGSGAGSEALTSLAFGADEYFAAVAAEPALAPYFALGYNVTVCLSGSSGSGCYATYGDGKDFVFMDILGHWAQSLILKYYEDGIVSGYDDNQFKPNNPVTRAEFIKILVHAYTALFDDLPWPVETVDIGDSPDVATEKFTDVPKDAWYKNHLNFAIEYKLIAVGADQKFRPGDKISRSEVLAILSRIFIESKDFDFESYADKSYKFSDLDVMPPWARQYLDSAYGLKLIKGYSDGTIKPLNNVTRAEAVVFVDNAMTAIVSILQENLESLVD